MSSGTTFTNELCWEYRIIPVVWPRVKPVNTLQNAHSDDGRSRAPCYKLTPIQHQSIRPTPPPLEGDAV